MLLSLLASAMGILLVFPKTPAARWLHTALVERPVAWVQSLRRRDVIFVLVAAMLLLSGAEFAAVFGTGELLALGMQVSIYLDAALVTAAATLAAGVASVYREVRARVGAWRGRPAGLRARASARSKGVQRARPRKAITDADPSHHPFAHAAA